jgi:hypothetical protein
MQASIIAAVIIRILGLILTGQYLLGGLFFLLSPLSFPLPPLISMIIPLLAALLSTIFAKALGRLVTFDFKD